MIRSFSKKLGIGTTAIIIAVGISAAAPSQAQDKMMIVKDRVALMKGMGKNLGMIGKAVKGEMAVDLAALGPAAGVIRTNAEKLKSMFPDGSGGGETRAKMEIWQEKAKFDGFWDSLASAADAFNKEAATGQMANMKASFGAIAKNCGGCHKPYRTPKS